MLQAGGYPARRYRSRKGANAADEKYRTGLALVDGQAPNDGRHQRRKDDPRNKGKKKKKGENQDVPNLIAERLWDRTCFIHNHSLIEFISDGNLQQNVHRKTGFVHIGYSPQTANRRGQQHKQDRLRFKGGKTEMG